MMGPGGVPDLEGILRAARIPVKVSCVLDDPNLPEVDGFLARCARIGVKRVVLRRLFGDRRPFRVLEGRRPVRSFRGNPVFEVAGMEVTLWDFDAATCRSVNLFPDGTLGRDYLLTETGAGVGAAAPLPGRTGEWRG
jgi:hypothetical protein